MNTDWRMEIVGLVETKQAIYEADSEEVWEFHLPRLAATAGEIAAVEASLGFELEPAYRNFLSYANGWPSFMQTVDLFGTKDLAGGPRLELAERMLDATDPTTFARSGLERSSLLPVAATTVDLDVFVMRVSDRKQQAPVVWFAGEEIDRFDSFDAFVRAMIRYNLRELERLTNETFAPRAEE